MTHAPSPCSLIKKIKFLKVSITVAIQWFNYKKFYYMWRISVLNWNTPRLQGLSSRFQMVGHERIFLLFKNLVPWKIYICTYHSEISSNNAGYIWLQGAQIHIKRGKIVGLLEVPLKRCQYYHHQDSSTRMLLICSLDLQPVRVFLHGSIEVMYRCYK